MIFHYVGKYNGDENSLPHREIPEDAVQVKEMENLTIASILGNIGQTILLLLMWKWFNSIRIGDTGLLIGIIAALLIFIPHEMLHAVCFQGDVYLYTNLKRAMCFVIGTEDMSFARYLFMGLCPNLVFGIFPFVIYLFFPHLAGVGIFGALCICIGFMDYVNIFKAMFQIPKDALVFMSGLRTYWYRKGSS